MIKPSPRSLIHFDINGNSVVLETATLTKLIRNLFLALLIPYLAIKVQSNSFWQTGLLKQVSKNIPHLFMDLYFSFLFELFVIRYWSLLPFGIKYLSGTIN